MTVACPTHPGAHCTKPPNTRQTCCLPRTAPNATSRPPTHPLQGMQWEIAAPTTAVLTGMPSHTLSRQRGMMRWPMDLLWGRNAQPRVGWMPQGLQVSSILWDPRGTPQHALAVQSWGASLDAATWESCQEGMQARLKHSCCCCEDQRGWVLPASTGSACECSASSSTAPQERGTHLVLSSHPLQNAPKPRHSLIKSSLVVSHRHKAIR